MIRKILLLFLLLTFFCVNTPPLFAETSNGYHHLLIPNAGLNALQVFDPVARTIVQTLPLPSPYTYGDPAMLMSALVNLSDGTIFTNVRDEEGAPTLLALTSSGQFLAATKSGGRWLQQLAFDPLDATKMTVLGGISYFVPPANKLGSEIRAIDPFAGTSVVRITRYPSGIIGMVLDATGTIFAGDNYNGAVGLYGSDGTYLGEFCSVILTTGMQYVNGMAQDGDGNIYVAQNLASRIAKYSASGSFLGVFYDFQNFNRPVSIFYNPEDDLLYVGNYSDDKLVILTTSFALVDVVPMGGGHIGTAALFEPDLIPPNQPPTADPNGPYLCAAKVSCDFNGSLSYDPDDDPLTYAWDFGDSNTGTGVTPTHTYEAAGIYDVCLTVNDGYVDSEAVCTIAVVYDPDGGFATGGGWIDSPEGAYVPYPSLAGKATFGFVSKYKKGATEPTGQTEFQFHVADLNFHSESYEWLVVTGSNYAMFKGEGTINGGYDANGNPYKFRIWAGDAEPDTFRIKIWEEDEFGTETVTYDNGMDQAIVGGSIKVHTE